MVMSTKVYLNELLNNPGTCNRRRSTSNCFQMIWLTGLCSTEMPIHVTLTAWSKTSNNEPKHHISHSGCIYSLRNSQIAKNVFQSGQSILLSRDQINLLTNNGLDMLRLQIIVH